MVVVSLFLALLTQSGYPIEGQNGAKRDNEMIVCFLSLLLSEERLAEQDKTHAVYMQTDMHKISTLLPLPCQLARQITR